MLRWGPLEVMTPHTSSSSHGKVCIKMYCAYVYKMDNSVLSAESVAVNPRTLELFVGQIRSHTKASKGPACPDIENKDLSSTVLEAGVMMEFQYLSVNVCITV